jgi:hypothetical protein
VGINNYLPKANLMATYGQFSQRFTKASGGDESRGSTEIPTGDLGNLIPVPGRGSITPLIMHKYYQSGDDDLLLKQIEQDYQTRAGVAVVVHEYASTASGEVTPVGFGRTYYNCLVTSFKPPESDAEGDAVSMIEVTLKPSATKMNFGAR